MPRLGVTRKADQLTTLTALAKQKGVEIIPLPLTKIVFLPFDLPGNVTIENIDWIIFTSANGVESFITRCKEMGWFISATTKIAAIGRKTKNAVEAAGYEVDFTPTNPYGDGLFKEFIDSNDIRSKTVIYGRAETVINDPAQLLKDTGCSYHGIICYRTDESQCAEEKVQLLSAKDYLFFTAPSSVSSYLHQFGKPIAKLIAIGQTTAQAIEKENWKLSIILDKPDIEKVLEYI